MAERYYPKKITTAAVGLTVPVCEEVAASTGKKPAAVLRIAGRVSKVEKGTTSIGEYNKFQGEFEAINLVDGSIHRSQALIVPPVAEQPLLDFVNAVKKESPDAVVEVAADITVQFYDNKIPNGTKFCWGVKPLIEPDPKSDSLSLLMSSFGEPPRLIASKPEEKTKGKK